MKHFRKGDGERSGLFTRRALVLGGAQAVLLTALRDLDPDSMSPREAMDALYRLKGLL